MFSRKRAIASMALTVVVSSVAAPAFAEGGFDSYMSGWLTGIKTRNWNDNNTDAASTSFAARACSYQTGRDVASIAMELNRNDTYTPDEHYGEKTLSCNNSTLTTVAWGNPGKGNFDMTLKKIDGQVTSYNGKLDVTQTRIKY